MAVPSDSVRPEDRRSSVRHTCAVPVCYRARSWWLLSSTHQGVICNVSCGGICLQTTRPYDPGTLLAVELPGRTGHSHPRRVDARVIHVRQVPVLHDWVLGCALQQELSQDEVLALVD
jgi:hypothetical protein